MLFFIGKDGSEDAPPISEPPVTEKPPETGEDTVTSSVTIVVSCVLCNFFLFYIFPSFSWYMNP